MRKTAADVVLLQAAQVLADFLCNGRRKHTGVGTRIGNQLFLVKLLDDFQRFIRADFEEAGTVVLQLRKVVEQRRIFILFFRSIFRTRGIRGFCAFNSSISFCASSFSGIHSPYREAAS